MAELKVDKEHHSLQQLQAIDPEIESELAYSRHCVAYLLSQDGGTNTWGKANIEGSGYLVIRKSAPTKQLLIVNNLEGNNLVETPHPDWELDSKPSFLFYKSEDTSKKINGIWFMDDSHRMKFEELLGVIIEEMREAAGYAREDPSNLNAGSKTDDETQKKLAAMGKSGQPEVPITVTQEQLQKALHGMADDTAFIDAIMQKLLSSNK